MSAKNLISEFVLIRVVPVSFPVSESITGETGGEVSGTFLPENY